MTSVQLVVLPYNMLLHGPTREAVGVCVKGNVVIIDEAHNLMDTISSVYSSRITGSHVRNCYTPCHVSGGGGRGRGGQHLYVVPLRWKGNMRDLCLRVVMRNDYAITTPPPPPPPPPPPH